MPPRSGSTAPRSPSSCAPKWAANCPRIIRPRRSKCSSRSTGNRSMPKGIVIGALVALVLIVAAVHLAEQPRAAGDDAVDRGVDRAIWPTPRRRRRSAAAAGPGRDHRQRAGGSRSGRRDDPQAGRACRRAELRSPGHRDRAGADHRQARGAAHFGRHRRCARGRPGRRARVANVSLLGPDLLRGPVAPAATAALRPRRARLRRASRAARRAPPRRPRRHRPTSTPPTPRRADQRQ